MSRESLLPLGLYSSLVEYQAYYDPQLSGPGAPRLWGLVLLSGLVSFFLNLANFLVTKHTSAVMLQVLGNVKAARPPPSPLPRPRASLLLCASPHAQRWTQVVLSILVSLLIFGNRVSASSAVGCAVTLAGVAAYNFCK